MKGGEVHIMNRKFNGRELNPNNWLSAIYIKKKKRTICELTISTCIKIVLLVLQDLNFLPQKVKLKHTNRYISTAQCACVLCSGC